MAGVFLGLGGTPLPTGTRPRLPSACPLPSRPRCRRLSLRHGGHRRLGHQRCALRHHARQRAEPGGGAAGRAAASHRGPGTSLPVSALYRRRRGPPGEAGSETALWAKAGGPEADLGCARKRLPGWQSAQRRVSPDLRFSSPPGFWPQIRRHVAWALTYLMSPGTQEERSWLQPHRAVCGLRGDAGPHHGCHTAPAPCP